MDPIFEPPEEIDLEKRWKDLNNRPYLPAEPGPTTPGNYRGDDDLTLPILAGAAPLITGLLGD